MRLTGRLETAATSNDRAGSLPDGQIASVNPAQQAARLRAPLYQAYVKLSADQPGSVGKVTNPDLSNPAGGAYEAQHFAYIIQWYAFAVLALLTPFLISRSEVRDARRQYLGIDPGEDEFGSDPNRPGRPTTTRRAQHVRCGPMRWRCATPASWPAATRLRGSSRHGRSGCLIATADHSDPTARGRSHRGVDA